MTNQIDFLFNRNYKYIVDSSVNSVRSTLSRITDKRWNDFSENITGQLKDDNSFKLTHRLTFGYIRWIENSFAYLTGAIRQEGDKTIIDTTVRPNSAIVLFFYIVLILFLFELFGIKTLPNEPKTYLLFFLPFFDLILVGLMLMMTNRLRNRFERIMHLKREEPPTT